MAKGLSPVVRYLGRRTTMKVAILGTGMLGSALGKGLLRNGHEVRFGSRQPAAAVVPKDSKAVPQGAAVQWGSVVVFAVPYRAVRDLVQAIGPGTFARKTVVDATNPFTATMDLAVSGTSSAAEELAKLLPGAFVVKAFNTVFAETVSTGRAGTEQQTAFVAGDDLDARQSVIRLAGDLGFHTVDAGKLKAARYLEPLALLLTGLGHGQEMGRGIGFRLVGKPRR